MAQLSWTQQVSQSKIATVADVRTRITNTAQISRTSQDSVNEIITAKLSLASDWMRQDLINYFQEKIPGKIQTFLNFKRSQVNQSQSEFSRNVELMDRGSGSWNYPLCGYLTPDGNLFSVSGYATFGQVPVARFNYGIPVSGSSGTFAGTAINGDLLCEFQYMNLYINREVDTPPVAPIWQLFQPSDAIDFLLNVQELKHALVCGCLAAMAQDGVFNLQSGNDPKSNIEFTQYWQGMYKTELARGISCVDVDISGSGAMNDWKRGFTRSEIAICG